MAGIGFELKKLYSENNTSYQDVKATFYSSLVSAGPWLITIASLIVFDKVGEHYLSTVREKNYFMVTLIYSFIFSQFFSGPWAYLINRYISDCIFEKRYAELKPSFIGIVKIVLVTSFICGILFMQDSSLPAYYNYTAVLLFTLLTGIWITMAYVSTVKSYIYIVFSYLVGNILGVVLMIVSLEYFTDVFPPFLMLISYVFGIGVTFFMLSSYMLSVFEHTSYAEFDFISYISKYSSLCGIGVFYVLGIWGHLFLQWYFGDAYILANVFKVTPFYANAMFYAYFITIPTIVYFYVFMETNFYVLYRNYYGLLNCNGSYSEVEEARELMVSELKKEINYILQRQLFITLAVVLTAEQIFAYLNISIYLLDIFQMVAFGAVCTTVVSIYIVLFLYFDFRIEALKVSALLAVSTIVFELVAIYNGENYYGLGFSLGALVTLIYSEFLLSRSVKILNYETFYKQNFIDKETPFYLKFIKEMLDKKLYLIILVIFMMFYY